MKPLKERLGLVCAIALGVNALICAANAADVVVTVVDDGVSNVGANGTLYWAITNAQPGDTIKFNITGQGAGPFYFKAPPKGFPLIYQKHGLTLDGSTQTGWSANTAAINHTNNAVIKIVLQGDATHKRDMAYVFYGKYPGVTDSDPPIDNTSMFGDGTGSSATGKERAGYDPDTFIITDPDPASTYITGESAVLGVYRSRNVTIKHIAIISDGNDDTRPYLIAVAQDFGYDTTVKERFQYDNGTCRGFHVAGCWFGIDPADWTAKVGHAGLAAYRHRDRKDPSAGGRPSALTDPNNEGIPNLENGVVGVAPGSANPRAEFNVFAEGLGEDSGANGSLAFEIDRCRISGNQLFGDTDIGRYSDAKMPAMIIGSDGDGVNDADEGNFFGQRNNFGAWGYLSMYNTQSKVYLISGNYFGLNIEDGSPIGLAYGNAIDKISLDQGTQVMFGSDPSAILGNHVYDAGFNIGVGGSAPSNESWLACRGNSLSNCLTPMISDLNTAYYGKFMDTSGGTAKPVITAATTTSLSGTCQAPKPAFPDVYVDVYISDPGGDAAGDPQGLTYLGTYKVDGPADSNPAANAFTFDISALGLSSGAKITLAATYRKTGAQPTITSITRSGANAVIAFTGGLPTYGVQQTASLAPANWISVGLRKTTAGTVTIPASGSQAYYRVTGSSFCEQTSPFATSATIP
jgi:hypothetical protein